MSRQYEPPRHLTDEELDRLLTEHYAADVSNAAGRACCPDEAPPAEQEEGPPVGIEDVLEISDRNRGRFEGIGYGFLLGIAAHVAWGMVWR